MLRIILFILAFPVTSFADVLDSKKVSDFWNYIAKNEASISSEQNIVLLLDEIKFELNKVHRDLVFEFSAVSTQPRHFVISADGIKANFPAVEELVRSAPQFQKLEIIAFRQPVEGPLPEVLQLGEASIRAEDLSFLFFTDRNLFDLVLIHDAFATAKRDRAAAISFLYLDASVGEFRVATEIGAIDFMSQDSVPAFYKPLPIERLPDALDFFINTRMP